jgi:hypothetical protein
MATIPQVFSGVPERLDVLQLHFDYFLLDQQHGPLPEEEITLVIYGPVCDLCSEDFPNHTGNCLYGKGRNP